MISLTFFPRLRAPRGQRVRTTWERLVERLSVARVVATKEEAPGLSLATFREDSRALANVERVFGVGLDFDKGVSDFGDLAFLFDNHDSFTHTTYSSTPEVPRARVFLRLSRPVTADEYRRVWRAVATLCEGRGLTVDRAASDPSRFWFLPSTPPGGEYRYSIGRGRPVNVDGALATVPPEEPPPAPPPAPPPSGTAGDVEARAAAYLDRCEPAIQGSDGSGVTSNVCVKLVKGFGLDEETALRLLRAWNLTCKPPWSERDLRRKLAWAREHGSMPIGALRDRPMRRAS